MPAVTVAICTRDRDRKLARAFEALLRMAVPDELTWELLVVDNASTDRTQGVIAAYSNRLPIRCVIHPVPGVSGARNVALRAARGRLLAWTDDDCVVDPLWLETIWHEFRADPGLGGLAGLVAPAGGGQRLPAGHPGGARVELTTDGRKLYENLSRVATCNAAFSRDAWARIGEFDEQLGTGTWAGSAEDWDYVYRAVRSRIRVAYCPAMVVYHHHGRHTPEELRALRRNYAVGRGAFYCKHIARGDAVALAVACQEVRVRLAGLWRHVAGASTWMSHLAVGAVYRVVKGA